MSKENRSKWSWRSAVVAFAMIVALVSGNTARANLTPASAAAVPSGREKSELLPAAAIGLAAITCAFAAVAGAYVYGLWKGKKEVEDAEKERAGTVPPRPSLTASVATLD